MKDGYLRRVTLATSLVAASAGAVLVATATVSSSGKAQLFAARSCIEDDT